MKFPKLGRKVTPPSPFISQKEAKRRAAKQIADLAKFLKDHPEIAVSERQTRMNRADITKKLLATRLRGNIPPMPGKRFDATHIEKSGIVSRDCGFPEWTCEACQKMFVFESDSIDETNDGAGAPLFCPMCGKKAGDR